ncbi:Zinc finger, TAZ-type [Plasmopara halstedii]|uniref:Zinc finger, TAZ-type n=1 Tax=Plasmopara halstedii TaxID=4781 RepID=A0A0P1B695_PLAHL|nr:Zinc finger, TAZ-type [Plasmopara halstedii]CEG50353.1 Zinc finger, TAZ-type [Plasmopara halstedii]|eukprot:XP_024586722.1 Zinc finger, TAZ-type [Plasmopara halstedii]
MMSWPEEPQNQIGEWPDTEMIQSINLEPLDGERSQHGTANLINNNSQSAPGLTSSASCPSFSGLYDAYLSGEASGNVLIPLPISSHEPLLDTMGSVVDTPFPSNKNYNMLLQFQQEYQNQSRRHFPHQQIVGQPYMLMQQQMPGVRRGIQSSQSYTNLSSMETEYPTNITSKRKKGSERWMKLQRHKSFDSSTPVSDSVSADLTENNDGAMNMNPSPDQLLQEPIDSDAGFYIDDFNTLPTNNLDWPSNMYKSTPSATVEDYQQRIHKRRHPSHQQPAIQSASVDNRAGSAFGSAEAEFVSELDMFLSDNEQANLFDAIRNFESPSVTNSIESQPSPELSPQHSRQTSSPSETKKQSNPFTEVKGTATDLPYFPEPLQGATRPVTIDTTSTPPAEKLPSGCVPMRTRLHQILVHSVQNSDAGSSLSSYEYNYLMQSPLFSPTKAPETAGSLWLLLHAAQCEKGCEIAGCSVMQRVLNHCLECELVVGKCKPICNDAKAMLLHYGSCNSKGSMHGRSCTVCWNLLEIDYSHQLLSSSKNNGNSTIHTSSSTPSPSPQIDTPPLVPMVICPPINSSPATHSPSRYSTPGATKHVPIQPNPLPTASNPIGLTGPLPPHLGHSLSLYLEQTSSLFRAEIKSRIEKRVTAAAGQDLLQHMQKKTRLRSLDDLRSDARAIVLGEMERELHLNIQVFNWANLNNSSGSFPDSASQLPPYLLDFSVAGYGAFHAQQAAAHQTDMVINPSLQASTLTMSSPVGTQQSTTLPKF